MAVEARTNAAAPAAAAASAPSSPAPGGDARPGASLAPVSDGASPAAGEASATPAPVDGQPKSGTDRQEVDFSNRFAALTKKERGITERERAVKAQEKAIADLTKARESARTDPLALLEAHGLSYDDVTQFVLNDRKLTEAQRLAILEERISKDETDRSAAAKEESKRQVAATIAEHKEAIKSFVDEGGDDYELTRVNDAYDLVYEVVRTHWDESGQILSIASAARAVEAHLENEAREKVLKTKRFQPKQEQPAADSAAPVVGDGQEPRRSPPTLTNRAVAGAPPPLSPEDARDLSDEDSKRRSAQMLRTMLKK